VPVRFRFSKRTSEDAPMLSQGQPDEVNKRQLARSGPFFSIHEVC